MRLSGQFQACLFFFYELVLSVKKHSQAKMNQQNKIKQTLNNKGNIFLCAQKLESRLFCVLVLFYAQNLFVKKNKKQA